MNKEMFVSFQNTGTDQRAEQKLQFMGMASLMTSCNRSSKQRQDWDKWSAGPLPVCFKGLRTLQEMQTTR